MLYWAITGKGSIYKSENKKAGKEEVFKKTIRRICPFGGLSAIAAGLLDMMKIEPLATIMYIVLCVVVVLLAVVSVVFTDKEKAGHRK